MSVILRDIAREYIAGDLEYEASDQPLQYADIAEWANELLEESAGLKIIDGAEPLRQPFENASIDHLAVTGTERVRGTVSEKTISFC